MATVVIDKNEVVLNGYKYKISGPVRVQSLSPFPAKMTIGDDSYTNRQQLSSWIINDQRGGIGKEDMDESVDMDRCWWSNCILKWKNHILPPRLAMPITIPDTETAGVVVEPTHTNMDCEALGTWIGTAGARSNTQAQAGTYSWKVSAPIGAGSQTGQVYQAVTLETEYKSKSFTFTCYVYGPGGAHTGCRIGIDDGVTTPTYSAYRVTGSWAQLTVTQTINASATKLWLLLETTTGQEAGCDGYFDTGTLYTIIKGKIIFANFNNNLYMARGNNLSKLNAGRTAFETVLNTFEASIKALIPSLNSRLYIYLGDTRKYQYMTTTPTFVESTSANAYYGFQWDGKLFKMNSTGTMTYSIDPDGASPTWAASASITDIASDIQRFGIGKDASGDDVPYCATKSILKVLDFTHSLWLDSAVKLPNHPNGGKGFCYWHDGHYISYGLGVKRYITGSTATISEVGLNKDDGLPVEYNGEITKLLGESASDEMFALVDASQVTGTAKSGLYAYDTRGWQCWWTDTSNDGTMYDAIISAYPSGYAIYWDCGSAAKYIDLPRGIQNPNKIGQSYATAGIWISPWFDAGSAVFAKLAKELHTFAKGVSTTETVAVKYRTNKTYTDLDTDWNTLDTLNTTGENGDNQELITTGAGTSINCIQLRLDFVTPGATAKPDIQAIVFNYKKRVGGETVWSWTIPIVCDEGYGTTAKQKWANLKAAKDANTDVLFTFRPDDAGDESYYVQVDDFYGTSETGRYYEGNFVLRVIQS